MSATNRGSERRENDFYETPEWCTRAFLHHAVAVVPRAHDQGLIWEPCAGSGAISRVLRDMYRRAAIVEMDAHPLNDKVSLGDARTDSLPQRVDLAITNPPYSHALEIAENLIMHSDTVALLLRLNWLASAGRETFLRKNPPSVHVLPVRPSFTGVPVRPSFTGKGTDATDYAWFVWSKLPWAPQRTVSIIPLNLCLYYRGQHKESQE